ncbi:thiolase family protein [Bacillus mojavensis]|uniref:thiolase family protein n=1 Tax=Bacillus mojavensis TaxID=72360 RepID=UPI002DC0059D|nr:thiolase family protein [Bacillus mojavensis]MEC1685486.1 thiolase family protein [Bacillus mojavensis]MEC1708283.1 thiolase family protein [Bacillus mojavensis]
MKQKVAIIGVGATPKPGLNIVDKTFQEIVVEASYAAIKSANIDPLLIEGATFSFTGEGEIGHGAIGATLVNALGLAPIPCFLNSANCSSGSVSIVEGYNMIESGEYEAVLVCGFDKQTDIIAFENYMLMSTDVMYDYDLGFSHLDAFMMANEYFEDNNISNEDRKDSLFYFAQLMRRNASLNPIATLYNEELPSKEQLESMPFSGNVLINGEGAAAILLASENFAKKHCKNPVFIEGVGFTSSSHYYGHQYHPELVHTNERDKPLNANMATGYPLKLACDKAYKSAGIKPKDLGMLGLYDMGANPFISIEAAGLCEKGQAYKFVLDGKADPEGECPVNVDGGNIGRGHVAGAGSIYQVIEIVKQLKGEAEGIQLNNDCIYGMSTVVGGYYATALAIILGLEKEVD